MKKSKRKTLVVILVLCGLISILKKCNKNTDSNINNSGKNIEIESMEERSARQLEEACNQQVEIANKKRAKEILYKVTNTTPKTADIYYMDKESYVDGRKNTSEIRKKYFVFSIDYLDDEGNAYCADYSLLVKKDNLEVYIYYPDGKMKRYDNDSNYDNDTVNSFSGTNSNNLNVNSTPKDVVEAMIKSALTNDMDLFLKCANPEDLEDYCRKYHISMEKAIELTQKQVFDKIHNMVQQYDIKLSDYSISQPDNYKERSRAYVQVEYLGNVKHIERHCEVPVYRAFNGKWYFKE
ncbi:hypothetical protein Z969_05000 [Clostridium novyi A str. 4570]|uniref:Uncharacterized protein n=1 Tax=Clostridium novyi A str. 4570 TaxID=1444290 RepID=A0AA88ZNI4_CLONO|nr:hypothetical protein [Clostridium novyi]KGN02441.1 hypothetical protein Z969_05000 [Clostridium novyi A str. 4570]